MLNPPRKSYGDALVIKYYMHVLLSWNQINMLLIDSNVASLEKVHCHQNITLFVCFCVCSYILKCSLKMFLCSIHHKWKYYNVDSIKNLTFCFKLPLFLTFDVSM